jgi:hypothetical protein
VNPPCKTLSEAIDDAETNSHRWRYGPVGREGRLNPPQRDDASEFSHGPGLTPRGLEGPEFGPAEGGRYWGKPPPPTAADLGERRYRRAARVRRVTRWARGGGMSTGGDATLAGLSSLIVLDRSMILVI